MLPFRILGENLADKSLLVESGFRVLCHTSRTEQNTKNKGCLEIYNSSYCPLRGDIRKNWNDTEKISMAPAQG
jgi:hypothetical protein